MFLWPTSRRGLQLFLSVSDVFKIGIGPSSSHTVGPMVAASRFITKLHKLYDLNEVKQIQVSLHGSLAFTGKGHGSDRAIILGLLGKTPETLDPNLTNKVIEKTQKDRFIEISKTQKINFNPSKDIIFDFEKVLPGHANAMVFYAIEKKNNILFEKTYYSIGGGFIVDTEELESMHNQRDSNDNFVVPFPFKNAEEMLAMGKSSGLSIAEMKRSNELTSCTPEKLGANLDKLWTVMNECINKGMRTEGTLPGGLKVQRRAKAISEKLINDQSNEKFAHTVMDWISVYALAVNEENAAGGKIVTAPTNGAAGIVPAVIRYYLDFCPSADNRGIHDFLLVASTIGGLIKHNASISGAEVGCQGEVGSASAMAAGGLVAVLGGSNEQIENAAEIALEHHLGMTCDPIGGLVQVPCIERNAFGAVKAINAASLALKGDGTHIVPLDSAIETMRQTGHDMLTKYKETSQGGLAVNVTEC